MTEFMQQNAQPQPANPQRLQPDGGRRKQRPARIHQKQNMQPHRDPKEPANRNADIEKIHLRRRLSHRPAPLGNRAPDETRPHPCASNPHMSIWNQHLCNLFKRTAGRELKNGEHQCPICSEIVPTSQLLSHATLDDQRFGPGLVIARIKQDHPDWIETDGACPKCVEFYRNTVATERRKIRVN